MSEVKRGEQAPMDRSLDEAREPASKARRESLANAAITVAVSLTVTVVARALAEPLHDPVVSTIRQITVFRALLLLGVVAVAVTAIELARGGRRLGMRVHLTARGASFVLGLIVGSAAGLWVVLGTTAALPRILGDELLYINLGKSVARGDGLLLRGAETYAYSFGYPAFLAVFYALADSAASAYAAVQSAQAYVMASAAIPVYFIARRVLDRPAALVAAALGVMTPHLLLSTLVMTEALVYPVVLWFCLAAVRALENPTIGRQAVAFTALAVAASIRLQWSLLAASLVTAVLLYPTAGERRRATLRRWIPSLVALGGAALLAGAAAIATGARPFGAYSVLLDLPDPVGVVVWGARTIGTLALSVGVVAAVALAPGTQRLLREGSAQAAVAAVSIGVLTWTLLVVSHFSATPWADEHVHERNAFIVTPLVLVIALAWAERGFPRPPLPTVAGAFVVLASVAALRQRDLLSTFDVDAPTLHVWRIVDAPTWPASRIVVLAALTGVAIGLSTRRGWVVALVAALAMLVATPVPLDEAEREATEELGWVDRAVGRDARVLVLTASPLDCQRRSLEELALWTELFNISAVRAGHIRRENLAANWDSPRMTLGPRGVVLEDGRPVDDGWVVLDSRLRASGTRVSHLRPNALGDHPRATVGLTLWRVDRPLRLLNADLIARTTSEKPCTKAS